jgi:hypothetical protein
MKGYVMNSELYEKEVPVLSRDEAIAILRYSGRRT